MNRIKLTIVLLFFCLVSFGQLKNGISLYLKGEGTTGRDERGLNNATPTNVTTGQTGKVGLAWEYNGTTSHSDASDHASLSFVNTMTISCWIYPHTSSGDEYIVIKGDDLGSGTDEFEYRFTLNGLHELLAGVSTDGNFSGSTTITNSGTTMGTNTWSYVTFVYDGSFLRLYIDAVEVENLAFSSNLYAGTADLHIGARFDDSESIYKFFFDGLIDELIISELAWNQSFISQHYANDNGRLYVWENFINGKINYSEWLDYSLKINLQS